MRFLIFFNRAYPLIDVMLRVLEIWLHVSER